MIGRHEAILRLRGAWWVRDRNVQHIFSVLEGGARKTRVVGGAVRDVILARPGREGDLDMASELLPEEVAGRVRAAGMACYPTGIDHGTVSVRNGQVLAEITTLRKDVRTDGRHARVEFGADWEADARRRDFTINALYADQEGNLFDPLDGLDDLFHRRVRFIGDPDRRLEEDRLRVFRFFRFCASHGGEVCDGEGLAACARFAGRLDNLSAERVGAEMTKILALPRIAATLAQMKKIGVADFSLGVLQLLARYEDRTVSPVVTARLALLGGEREELAGPALTHLQAAWRLSNTMVREALDIRRAAELMINGQLFEAAYRHQRVAYAALPVAGALAGWDEITLGKVREFWQGVEVPSFPLSGDDLLAAGFRQGPALGQALRRIEMEWVRSGFNLQREELLAKLADYVK